jgi:nitronate monooxygenase
MALGTRLTEMLGIAHPILLAPMASVAGGRLAAAVTDAGGLGLIGGGYGNAEWLDRQFAAAGNHRVGCGFITWSLAKEPALLDQVLAHRPAAVMLSFGDPRPFGPRIAAAGSTLICQVQTRAHVEAAIEAGARIIVAQGADAGGHGAVNGTVSFVPAIVDLVARRAPEAIVVAAGGLADGRGLAAALMLGADGVLMGTRFYASEESLAHADAKARVVAASGEETVRTSTVDLVRGLAWPSEFTARVMHNDFVDRWHGAEDALARAQDAELARYQAAVAANDFSVACVFAGEAIGLIDGVLPARVLVERTVAEAEAALARGAARISPRNTG